MCKIWLGEIPVWKQIIRVRNDWMSHWIAMQVWTQSEEGKHVESSVIVSYIMADSTKLWESPCTIHSQCKRHGFVLVSLPHSVTDQGQPTRGRAFVQIQRWVSKHKSWRHWLIILPVIERKSTKCNITNRPLPLILNTWIYLCNQSHESVIGI